jgi:hypothetical protein
MARHSMVAWYSVSSESSFASQGAELAWGREQTPVRICRDKAVAADLSVTAIA